MVGVPEVDISACAGLFIIDRVYIVGIDLVEDGAVHIGYNSGGAGMGEECACPVGINIEYRCQLILFAVTLGGEFAVGRGYLL